MIIKQTEIQRKTKKIQIELIEQNNVNDTQLKIETCSHVFQALCQLNVVLYTVLFVWSYRMNDAPLRTKFTLSIVYLFIYFFSSAISCLIFSRAESSNRSLIHNTEYICGICKNVSKI